jgi:hypothetical protein
VNGVAESVAAGRWDRIGSVPLDATAVGLCDAERTLGLLADAVDRGHVPLTDAAAGAMSTRLHRLANAAVTLDSRLIAAVELLHQHSIETRVLKGAAVARLDYERPELRPYGDVDLLLRGPDVAHAVSLLAEHGYRRHFAEPFDGHDEQLGKGVAVEGAGNVVIDLHRTLALGYYGTRIPIDDLWVESEPIDVEGTPMQALPRLERFLHAAVHGSLSPRRRLTDSLDVVTIWRGQLDRSPLPTAAIVDGATRWGVAGRVAGSIRIADSRLPGLLAGDLVAWARDHRRRATEWVVDQAYDGRFAGSRWRTISSIGGLPGWRRRLRLTTAYLRSVRRRG